MLFTAATQNKVQCETFVVLEHCLFALTCEGGFTYMNLKRALHPLQSVYMKRCNIHY